MNHFTIFAHGKDFDAKEYVAHSPLKFDYIWYKGDRKRCAPEDMCSQYETSGVELFLGDGLKLNRFEQETIAKDFIRENKEALKDLSDTLGIETVILGIQYVLELEINVIGFTASFSSQLMALCLEVGICPTFYFELIRKYTEE